MIDIKIEFLSTLVDIIGETKISISIDENKNINYLLIKLFSKFGTNFKQTIVNSNETLNKYIIISLNGKDIRLIENLNTILHHGDVISFLPAIAGG
jgi:MoaD family protein